MPTYETLFITPPTLSDEEERETVALMAAIVTDAGGSFTVNDRMGRRRLAYPIKKFEDGVYTRFLYDCDIETPKELERRIRISDNVLRSLTVRLEENWAVASKIQAVKDAERRAEMEIEAARLAAEEAELAAAAAEAAANAPAEGAEGTEGSEEATTAADGETAPAPAAASEPVAEAAPEQATAEPAATDEAATEKEGES